MLCTLDFTGSEQRAPLKLSLGILPSNRLMGCATGWGRTLTAGLTLMGSHFH